MKYNHIICILFTLSIISCTSQDEDSFKFDLSTVFNQINFDQPAVGQISTYIYFNGTRFGDENASISYTGDTLEVSLVSTSGGNFTFQERITDGSSVHFDSDPYIDGHDLLKTSQWQLQGDSLSLTGGETFLDWNMNSKIALSTSQGTPVTNLTIWGPSPVDTNLYYSVSTANINDFNFENLSISFHVISQNVHSDVNYLIGNRSFGIVRTSFFNSNDISGHGWDLQLGN